jgi:hypothetical protein
MKKHADTCCLGKLETLTDDQYRGVLATIVEETKRRWPRLHEKSFELAEGYLDEDFTAQREVGK